MGFSLTTFVQIDESKDHPARWTLNDIVIDSVLNNVIAVANVRAVARASRPYVTAYYNFIYLV